MALYASRGADVTLVTCTRGEEGEVLIADLAHLAAHMTDTLGDHRVTELAHAMKALGVSDHRFLGEGQPPLPILSPRVVDALNVRIDWETRETSIFGFSL